MTTSRNVTRERPALPPDLPEGRRRDLTRRRRRGRPDPAYGCVDWFEYGGMDAAERGEADDTTEVRRRPGDDKGGIAAPSRRI